MEYGKTHSKTSRIVWQYNREIIFSLSLTIRIIRLKTAYELTIEQFAYIKMIKSCSDIRRNSVAIAHPCHSPLPCD